MYFNRYGLSIVFVLLMILHDFFARRSAQEGDSRKISEVQSSSWAISCILREPPVNFASIGAKINFIWFFYDLFIIFDRKLVAIRGSRGCENRNCKGEKPKIFFENFDEFLMMFLTLLMEDLSEIVELRHSKKNTRRAWRFWADWHCNQLDSGCLEWYSAIDWTKSGFQCDKAEAVKTGTEKVRTIIFWDFWKFLLNFWKFSDFVSVILECH